MDISQIATSMQMRSIQSAVADAPRVRYNTSQMEAKPQQSAQSMSPLSSRYTYAMGNDGRRYVLQLRIDIATASSLSMLA